MDGHGREAGVAGRPRVLVLGGFGFIGRHTAAALLAAGCTVWIGSRAPWRHRRDRLQACIAGCRQVRFERQRAAGDWNALLDGIDVVINCVGILRQRGRETYRRVHHEAPATLAAACRQHALRLIHVSALGLGGRARSGFLRSKHDGEAAVRAADAEAVIVRPSLLDAEHDGYGAAWLRRVARWPLHPLPADATGRIAVLHVDDLGEALARLAIDPAAAGGTEVELGGDDALTLGEHLAALRRLHRPRPALRIPLPGWFARAVAHACDVLHATPFSFGHWELLRRDNLPHDNRLRALLGRAPRRLATGAAAAVPAWQAT